jgi:hypothetical protein
VGTGPFIKSAIRTALLTSGWRPLLAPLIDAVARAAAQAPAD